MPSHATPTPSGWRTAVCLTLAWMIGLNGCADDPERGGGDGAPCVDNGDCLPSFVCFASQCTPLCNDSGDCPRKSQVCDDGVCREASDPSCTEDGDCTTPGRCELAEGAICRGAVCLYPARPDLSRCPLAGEDPPGGYCAAGACVECTEPEHCGPSPTGNAACFDAVCTNRACSFELEVNRVCEAQQCAEGLLLVERHCDSSGACPAASPPWASCGGYACNDAGDDCLTTCQNPDDCTGGLDCLPGNVCESPRAVGEACTFPGECASEFCADGVCCDTACDGICQRCDDVDGVPGECHLVAAGNDPDDECTSRRTNCDQDHCSGAGPFCEPQLDGIECGSRSCDGPQWTMQTCAAGQCADAVLVESCNDGNPCTDDNCDPVTGCSNPENADSCNDGDSCTYDDACDRGSCSGTPITCNNDSDYNEYPACGASRSCNGTPSCNVSTYRDVNCTCGDFCCPSDMSSANCCLMACV